MNMASVLGYLYIDVYKEECCQKCLNTVYNDISVQQSSQLKLNVTPLDHFNSS
jgi:hypothetical protein